jgi:hypothetical protein
VFITFITSIKAEQITFQISVVAERPVGFQVKSLLFSRVFKLKCNFSHKICQNSSGIIFRGCSLQGSRVATCGQRGGQTGIAKFKFGSFVCERNIIKISRMDNIFYAGNVTE